MNETRGRPAYECLSRSVRHWVEHELGSQVVSATTQPNGFSPGVAARLVTSYGARAFVKAIATSVHAPTARLHRCEVQAMTAIPPSSFLPRLYGSYDDGDWVALLIEDIDGQHPVTSADDEFERVITAVTDLSRTFTPTPWRGAEILSDTARVRTRWWTDADDEQLPAWMRAHRTKLVALDHAAPAIAHGTTLCHRDLQAENILITSVGRVVFIDWAWACQAPIWADTVQLVCNLASSREPADLDALIAAAPLAAGVDPRVISSYVLNLTGSAVAKSRQIGPDNIPALQAFRRTRADALLRWLRHRLRW